MQLLTWTFRWPIWVAMIIVAVGFGNVAHGSEPTVVIDYIEVRDAPDFKIYFDFLNEAGNPVQNVELRDVKILINGDEYSDKEAELTAFKDSGEGCAYVLLMNNYLAYQSVWDNQKRGLREFVRGMRPRDRAAIFAYSDQVRSLVEFSSDKEELLHAIDTAPPPDKPQEVFIDAVIAALDSFPSGDPNFPRRRGIVLLGDALDQDLFSNRQLIVRRIQQELAPKAKALGVKFYALGYSIESREGLRLMHLLQRNLGGYFREVRDNELGRIGEFFSNIQERIQSQYILEFNHRRLDPEPQNMQLVINYRGNNVESVPEQFVPPEVERTWWGWWVLMVLGIVVGVLLLIALIVSIIRRPKLCPECGEELDPEEEHDCPAHAVVGEICNQCNSSIPPGILSCNPCLNGPHFGKLTIVNGPKVGRVHVIKDEVTVIGSREGSIRVVDPTVSGKHAGIRVDDMKFELADFDSTNGTYVNGKRVTRLFLKGGDSVRLGNVECRFSLK